METINFLNGDVRHVDFVNGLIICEETGKSILVSSQGRQGPTLRLHLPFRGAR